MESESPRRRKRTVPGGIVAHKRALARQGGFMGLAVGASLLGIGGVVLILTDGSFAGVLGFVFVICGAPLLSVVGIPAVSSSTRWFVALAGSAVLWWWIGQISAARVRKRAVAGWREWTREFGLYAGAVWIGALAALGLAAKALGAI